MAARADPEAEEEEEAARPSKANEVGNVVEAVEDETIIRKTLLARANYRLKCVSSSHGI
jgi:hypothetical protein